MHKIRILIIIGLVYSIAGCDTDDSESAQHIATVQKYITAVENMDYETMGSMLADDYLGLGPSVNDTTSKPQALSNWKKYSEELYENISYERSRFISVDVDEGENQGDWVANWALVKIKYKDVNESAMLFANTIYQLKDDKIVKSYTFYNEADVLEQLGYVFIHPDDL